MNDLISDGPVDVAPECSSVPWFAPFPVPSSHHGVGEDLRWCFPHLNANDSFTPLEKYTTHFMMFQRGTVRH